MKLIDDQQLETHLLGDLNINYIANANHGKNFENKKWGDVISKYGFQQLIDKPTRVSKHKASIIDHIYSNTRDVIKETSEPDYTISDHLPVCFTRFTGECKKTNEHKSITYRSFKHSSKEAFISDKMTTDFNLIEQQSDINGSLSLFYDLLNSVVSKHAPIKQKRVRYVKQPGWFNEEIKNSIHKRNGYYKKKDWENYRQARNKTTALIRKSKINFFNKAISENQNVNYLWQHLKHMNVCDSSSTYPEVIEMNNDTITNTTEIANVLNSHFVSISNIIEKENNLHNHFSSLKECLDKKLEGNYFDIKPITVHEVKHLLNKLNTNKSTGLDGIGPKILKLCWDNIVIPITYLINKSLTEGVFPSTLKTASVIPLHKSGPKSDPNNYRPISILPTISKFLKDILQHSYNPF